MDRPLENMKRDLDGRRPGGFTLFEVLLVMALIILIGALTMPGFSRTFENQRLRESGDIIRTAWAKGRIEAMKSGRTMLFRHELGGNRYLLEPWHGNDEYLELGDAAAGTMLLVDEQQEDDVPTGAGGEIIISARSPSAAFTCFQKESGSSTRPRMWMSETCS